MASTKVNNQVSSKPSLSVIRMTAGRSSILVSLESFTASIPCQTASGNGTGRSLRTSAKPVIDQGGQQSVGLLLGDIALDDQVDVGKHLGVAQKHVDVGIECALVGEERNAPHGAATSRAVLPVKISPSS